MNLNKHQQRTLDHAIEYADKGWHIFPVSKMTKKPLILDWTNKASSDRSQVISWFNDYPAMNIGVVTGEKSQFWAIGLDIRGDASGLDSLKNRFGSKFVWDLKKWLVGITATGGFHFLIQWDPENPINTNASTFPGVYTRGHGGHIVVSPSSRNIDNKWVEYRWNGPDLPICPCNEYEWVQEVAALSDEPSAPTRFTADDITRTMAGLQKGARNETLNRYALHLKAHDIDLGLALGFIEAACEKARPPFDKNKAEDMLRRAYEAEGKKKDKTAAMNKFKVKEGKLIRFT
jgi:hypothetical protein